MNGRCVFNYYLNTLDLTSHIDGTNLTVDETKLKPDLLLIDGHMGLFIQVDIDICMQLISLSTIYQMWSIFDRYIETNI